MKTMPWENEELAANGRSIKENFLRWFDHSKAVNAEGSPLMLYHGTNQSFDAFSPEQLGNNTRACSATMFYFTDNAQEAGEYSELAGRQMIADLNEHEKKVEKLLQQIAKAEKKGNWDEAERLTSVLEDFEIGAIRAENSGQHIISVYLSMQRPKILQIDGMASTGQIAIAIEDAKRTDCDGLILSGIEDCPVGAIRSNHYLVFHAQQIKSSIGNSGLYLTDSDSLTDLEANKKMLAAQFACEIIRKRARVLPGSGYEN